MTVDFTHLDEAVLSSLLDDRLEAAERARVERHLAECSACSQQLADLRTTLRLLRELPEVEPPRDFLLAETARQLRLRSPQSGPLALRVAPWTRVLGSVAAGFFVVLVGVDLLGVYRQPAAPFTYPLDGFQPETAAPRAAAPAEKPAVKAAPKPAEAPRAAPAEAAKPAAPAGVSADAPAAAAPAPAPAASPAAASPRPERATEPLSARAVAPTPALEAARPLAEASRLSTGAADSPLRPWQVLTGLLAAALLIVSFMLPRLARKT
jgi:hypothetical protein